MKKRTVFRNIASKKTALIVGLIFYSVVAFGQHHEDVRLIALDSTWGKEIFPFPIAFAQNINYEGVEEARFPPEGWSDASHQNFWSYAFAWDINLNKKITEAELTSDLEKYFNGLVGEGFIKEHQEYKTSASFIEVENEETRSLFKGKVKTYDGFTTKKGITLHVLVESHYCIKEGRSVLLFRFSPKDFTHAVWKMLEKVTLTEGLCDE